MNSLESDRIRGLLESKIRFLEEILDCSKNLADLSYAQHGEEYNNLLKTREKYIDALKSVENALRERLDPKDSIISQAFGEPIASLTDHASELLREILLLDQKSISTISDEIQNVKSKLKAISRGRKGVAGYNAGQRINIAGAFTDNRK